MVYNMCDTCGDWADYEVGTIDEVCGGTFIDPDDRRSEPEPAPCDPGDWA